MNVIDYITITCNLKNVRLQITFDYMKNVIDYNRLQPITITNYDYLMSGIPTNKQTTEAYTCIFLDI
jgi:hypothetical protein